MVVKALIHAGAASLAPLLLAGCLASSPEHPVLWTVEAPHRAIARQHAPAGQAPVKLAGVSVASPYNSAQIAVLRPDGSIAFDPYNCFAAQPSSLLAPAAFAAVERKTGSGAAIRPNSSAAARRSVEITVSRFALDCREEGRRKAAVELSAALVEGRNLSAVAKAEAEADAASGDFSAAFSKAFADAADEALAALLK